MPKVPHYSTCTDDPTAWEISATSVAVQIGKFVIMNFTVFGVLAAAGAVSGIAQLAVFLLNLQVDITSDIIGMGCVAGVAALYALVLFIDDRFLPWAGSAAPGLLTWFRERRLGCMRNNEVAAGILVNRSSNDNGDDFLHLALSPFSPAEHLDTLESVYAQQSGKQVFFPEQLYMELSVLTRASLIQIYQRAVHEHFLVSPSARLFQARFFAKSHLPPELSGAKEPPHLPDDSFKPGEATNPLFRCPWDEDTDDEKLSGSTPLPDSSLRRLFVWMPAVIEGRAIIDLLEALRNAFFAAALAMALVCGVCLALTGGNDALCSVIAGIAAFLAWLITFWISRNSSGGGSGGGKTPEFEGLKLADPSGTGDSLGGDTVAVFGDWVMDPAHDHYYAIQPVKAWYLICKPAVATTGMSIPTGCTGAAGEITEERYNKIRETIRSAEGTSLPATMDLDNGAALSMLGGFDRLHSRIATVART